MLKQESLIQQDELIKIALKKLSSCAERVLLVVGDENKLLGTLTDGDIRRHILSGRSLEDNITEVYNRKPVFIKNDFSIEEAKDIFLQQKIDLIPILDRAHAVIDSITWDEAFSGNRRRYFQKNRINIPVVIMSGGEGRRLEPFSNILPKSLIPVGDKPIVEMIIDEFREQGADNFFLTLNYKGKMIEAYFDSMNKDYQLHYVWDGEASGTAASLKLLEKDISDTFIVSNCDVIIKADFSDVFSLHKKTGAVITMVSSIQHHRIPYGVVRLKKEGDVCDIVEKPEYTFMVNSGVYLVDKRALHFIPPAGNFDMTDLIKALLRNNEMVGTYPVNESDYIDIGQWEEYKKSLQKLSNL